jgi:excisionase family DNA binding protein
MSDLAAPAEPEAPLPRLMSIAEAAAYFNRTPRTMNRWVARGVLPVVRVGQGKFVLADHVQMLITEQIAQHALGFSRSA